MPSAEQLRKRLVKKLTELFQLDQPDLDFGFYRIMHARAREVQEFINNDLLQIVAEAFGDADEAQKAELKAKWEEEIRAAEAHGVPEPEDSPRVREAEAAYNAVKDSSGAEAAVYDHLYRFFERYYDNGDFISRRYHTRETSGKAAPFAIPYNGEEVKLVWANMDQYYIKTTEYFSNFTFDLTKAAGKQIEENLKRRKSEPEDLFDDINRPAGHLRVHFRVREATEGEHGNVKGSEQNRRYFIIHRETPVEFHEAGELVCNFEYRPDPDKTGTENKWQDTRNAEAVETITAKLKEAANSGIGQAGEYLRLLTIAAPTENEPTRPLLARYVKQYSARNTMDYFIHKDLGGFLRRELDFYIKNEVMSLDDIENADAPAVERYLDRIRVLRKIAGQLIDFLAQLENFQKKLWLKKKFVIETNYCVTLDRIIQGEEESEKERRWFAEQIAANDAQMDEWVKLGFIEQDEIPSLREWLVKAVDEPREDIPRDLFGAPDADFTLAPSPFSLHLVLDTRFFDERFKARLLASIDNFDDECDGLLIHSENFQALNLLQERYREQVKCVYIDPPYNTGEDGFTYKDSYQYSSWLSMMEERIFAAYQQLDTEGIFLCSIDDYEINRLHLLMRQTFGDDAWEATFIRKRRTSSAMSQNLISQDHEYVACYTKRDFSTVKGIPKEYKSYRNPDNNPRGPWTFGDLTIGMDSTMRPNQFYDLVSPFTGKAYPANPNRVWSFIPESMQKKIEEGKVAFPDDPKLLALGIRINGPMLKRFKAELKSDVNPVSTLIDTGKGKEETNGVIHLFAGLNTEATKEIQNFFGNSQFTYAKPMSLVSVLIDQFCTRYTDQVMDFFAGSGTTGHAVINLNREDGGKRKYILVEMGDHFDTVLKPRIAKVVYSEGWKDGKPTARNTGISHCFKYIRLESYEDTLNNLILNDEPSKSPLMKNPSLREDYMLRYLLDVETRGSQSLLNLDAIADPTAYCLEVKMPGTDEYAVRHVDMIETFHYLIGLRVDHIAAPQEFTAKFKRARDPEAPQGQKTRLVLDGKLQQIKNRQSEISSPAWWFRKVEGWVPKDPSNPGSPLADQKEKVLIVWRRLTGDIVQDNLILDAWFEKNRIMPRDFEFDVIYVNGSNNLPNLRQEGDRWKVRLIEEEFLKRMWEVEQ